MLCPWLWCAVTRPALCPEPSLPCWALLLQPLALQHYSLTPQSCKTRKAHSQLIHTLLVREAPGLHSLQSAQTGGHGTALAQGHPAATGASTGCCDGLVKGSGCICSWAVHYLILCSEVGSQRQRQPGLTPNPVLSTAASALACRGSATTWGCAPGLGLSLLDSSLCSCAQPGPCSQSCVPQGNSVLASAGDRG